MIQVIHRALDILEYLSVNPDQPKPLSEIATHLNLNAGTCANIIKTLTSRNFIKKDDHKRGYSLGSGAYRLTGNEAYHKHLIEAATPEMELLRNSFNENVLLAVLDQDNRVAIQRINSTHNLQVNVSDKKRAYFSASGRLLLAMQSEAQLNSFLINYGLPKGDEWVEIKDEKSLRKALKKISEEKISFQVIGNDTIGLAVPIFLHEKSIASLSVYMPLYRYESYNKEDVKAQLELAAEAISLKLTGNKS